MHTFSFSTELVSRIVRTLACGGLAIFFAPDSTEQCSTNVPLLIPASCDSIEDRIAAQLLCDNTRITISEVFTVPGGTCASTLYTNGFPLCHTTGSFSMDDGAASYTWSNRACTVTIY